VTNDGERAAPAVIKGCGVLDAQRPRWVKGHLRRQMATGQLPQSGREVLRRDQLLAQAGATVIGNIGESPQAIEELGALLG
jgi:hypothetical protein